MPFIPVPQTAEAVMTYQGPNGQRVVNVFNLTRNTGDWDYGTLLDLGNAMVAWESASCRAGRSSQISFVGVTVRDLSVVDSLVLSVVPGTPIAGQQTGATMPMNVTWAAKLLTGRAGRSYRGRSYWIGLAENEVAGDFILQTRATAIVAALNALRSTTAPSVNAALTVVSRWNNGAARTVGVATAVTQVGYTDLRVDTQRRRLVGEGN